MSGGPISVQVRPMLLADIDAVARLRHAAFFEGTARSRQADAEDLRSLLGSGGGQAARVATVDGRLVGTCLLVARELDALHDLTPWLAGLAVHPAFQTQGIGTALARAIEKEAAGMGFDTLHLYTDAAEPFYARLGWVAADRFEDEHGVTVLMKRRLER